MNTPISFESAKLLKEKGWIENTYSNCWVKTFGGDIIHNKDRKNISEHDRCEHFLMQPTIVEVVMWLHKKYGIWIVAWKNPDNPSQFYFEIDTPVKRIGDLSLGLFSSPEAAYEAAILYTLNNLI